MQERRLGRAIVEELEALAGRDGTVVVALNEQRASLPQERKRVAWVRSVSDGVTGHPQRVDLPERREDRLERDEVRVDVGKEPYPHAAFASASVKRPSRNARPITTDAAPQRASARTSSTSRTPPPVWMAVSAPIFARRRSMRTSGGPPRRPSTLVSITYSARIPRSAAISAASAASRPDARRTRSASPPRGATGPEPRVRCPRAGPRSRSRRAQRRRGRRDAAPPRPRGDSVSRDRSARCPSRRRRDTRPDHRARRPMGRSPWAATRLGRRARVAHRSRARLPHHDEIATGQEVADSERGGRHDGSDLAAESRARPLRARQLRVDPSLPHDRVAAQTQKGKDVLADLTERANGARRA